FVGTRLARRARQPASQLAKRHLLVKPETVLRWHREGFRLFWRRKSKASTPRQARIASDAVELIRRMATDNRTWGAERIRGELLKLDIRVSKRTIQRHIHAVRPTGDGQSWRTFLKNHTVWACDFIQTYDIWFRPIFAFFIIAINSNRVVHLAATYNPTQQWTPQQLRNATTLDERLDHVIIREQRQLYIILQVF